MLSQKRGDGQADIAGAGYGYIIGFHCFADFIRVGQPGERGPFVDE